MKNSVSFSKAALIKHHELVKAIEMCPLPVPQAGTPGPRCQQRDALWRCQERIWASLPASCASGHPWPSLACRRGTRASPCSVTPWFPILFPLCAPASSCCTLRASPLLFPWRHRSHGSGTQSPPVSPHLYLLLDAILQRSYFQRRPHSQVLIVTTLMYLFGDTFNSWEIGRDNSKAETTRPMPVSRVGDHGGRDSPSWPMVVFSSSHILTPPDIRYRRLHMHTRQDPNITYYY